MDNRDIDISDILAEVSRPDHHSGTSQSHSNSYSYSDTDAYSDHQLLTRAWTSERCAPELLPYPHDLMERIMARVQTQISRIEDIASSGPEGGVGQSNGHGYGQGYGYGYGYSNPHKPPGPSGTQNANLILSILQTDLSRTQFLVRSFLRQRLAKLTKHAGWYLAQLQRRQLQDSNVGVEPETERYLSPAESQFLRAHQSLLSELYGSSFLNAFPPTLRRLDDSTGGVPMVEPPDAGAAVVVRCLVDGVWSNEGDVERSESGGGGGNDENGEPATVELRMRRGEVWVVRWRDVRRGVERGELGLL
ncbi:hypothetical protein A1O1_03910 [Capronia coronata CBS 617.96]|uniref:DNA replication complex GINS protein SLD5 n=1 Tax=Capronia coronata CBS 617.96 TaxID=1182541 RepID=W9YM93_9EURO|nr:uncharacterized protein A1O1_03910 [Capronia coronata CBS 617.96]EXJ90805.1 hypothetical protein A1O1_03910 [Capronia coronata CBS 617.96]